MSMGRKNEFTVDYTRCGDKTRGITVKFNVGVYMYSALEKGLTSYTILCR